MSYITISNFLIIFTMFIGMINLFTPFLTKDDSNIRSFLLLLISITFFCNILIIDYLFLEGIDANFILLNIGKYSLALHTEPLGLIFLTMISALWICSLLYTIKFITINNLKHSSCFLFFINCCVLIGCFIALSANLFTMFVGYEILTICTIPLIIHQSGNKEKNALFKYLNILMLSSTAMFLPAIIIIYSKIGHGYFIQKGFISGKFSDNVAILLLLMFIFGIAKAAVYPLHNWLPAAMVASYPVSALLHAVVVVKAGLFCIYKILIYVFGLNYLQELFSNNNWLVLLPAITIIYSSLQALRYNNIKMILAFSTINQLSIALISAFLLSPKGIIAAVLHMISHSFTKICLFYAAGNIYSVKSSSTINELIGIKDTMPKTSFVILIAGLSLIGIPPFGGFISKLYIMLAAAEQSNLFVMIILGISSLFSAFYMTKILIFIYRPTSSDFILHLKLKPYFIFSENKNNSIKIRHDKYRAENKIPLMMIISIGLCLSVIVMFFFVTQLINKFLIHM